MGRVVEVKLAYTGYGVAMTCSSVLLVSWQTMPIAIGRQTYPRKAQQMDGPVDLGVVKMDNAIKRWVSDGQVME